MEGIWALFQIDCHDKKIYQPYSITYKKYKPTAYISLRRSIMTEDLFTIGDIARKLDVPQHRIAYLIQRNKAKESFRLGNRRVFTEKDMANIAHELNQQNHSAGRPPSSKGEK